jgi:serine/threonine-protein kinase
MEVAASLASRSLVRKGEVLGGKYLLERRIGAGSMGLVFAARHVELELPVAIKVLVIDPETQDEAEARFRREVRAVARLRSEHAVRVFDVGRTGSGAPYLVMEYVEGVDLSSILAERGGLRVQDAIELALQACEAVSEAHAAGIVHRDLKPKNMMVTRRFDGTPLLKVFDFGVAKITRRGLDSEPRMTVTNSLLGSPEYMSPEQVSSPRDVDARADVWALGVTLYEMLSGRVPFEADNVPSVLTQIVREEPRPLREVAPHVPASLEAVVMKCLRKRPEERFQSVFELGKALEAFEGRDFQPAQPEIPRDRPSGSRWKRAAAFLLAGIAAGVALGVAFNHATGRAELREAIASYVAASQ